MKKFIGALILSFMFCNISVAEDDKKFLNDYLKDGYDIVKVDIKDTKTTRIYTLKKEIVSCYVTLG